MFGYDRSPVEQVTLNCGSSYAIRLCYRIRYGIFECSEELVHRVSAKTLYKPAKMLRDEEGL